MGNCKGLHGEVMTDVLFFQAVASTLLAQGLPEGCKIVFHSLISLYTLADRQCPPPPPFYSEQLIYVWSWTLVLFGWNAKNFKDPPPLPVPSSRKQMEQAPAWADESPPVLPQRGREGECKEWKRQEERSIRFSQSACFSWIFRLDLSVDLYFNIKKT